MAGLSQDEIQAMSDAYLMGEDISGTPKAQDMARAYADRVQREFRKLKGQIDVEFTERDPYRSHEELAHDVLVNKRMYVFTGFSDTPLWSPEINWQARAVHDFDHVMANTDFSLGGELHAFQVGAAKMPQLEPLFLSEVALQAAVSVVTGSFAPGKQKVVLASPDIAKIAQRYRRNSDEETREAAEVWDAAGALKFMAPEEMMTLLAANGVPFEQALTLVIAAETAEDLSVATTEA